MSARNQLNTIYIYGILIVAALTAIVLGSWTLFVIVLPVMAGLALADGSIRLSPNSRKKGRGGGKRRR